MAPKTTCIPFLALSLVASAAIAAPDPLARLSHDASAVLLAPDGAQVMLNEEDYGVRNTRTLRVGDEYNDGWTITAIAAAGITLSKDGQSRTIRPQGAYAPASAQPSPSAPPQAAAGPVSLAASNAGLSPGGKQASINDAITKGDPARVRALGGTAQEMAQATFQQMDRQRLDLLKPGAKSGAPERRAINRASSR